LIDEGLFVSGEVEIDLRCFSFHDGDARALSEELEIPNDFAIWVSNLSKDFT
jgi:hypothetical protein